MRVVRGAVRPVLSLLLVAASSCLAAAAASAATTPEAGISISPTSSPLTVRFTAQASGRRKAVRSYKWSFGDGTTVTTSANTVRHTYSVALLFPVSVEEMGQQAQLARATGILDLFSCPVLEQLCSATLQATGLVQTLSAVGPINTTAPANQDLFIGPFRFPHCDSRIQPAVALSDWGFTEALTVELVYQTSHPNQAHDTCFSSEVAFVDADGLLVHSGPLPLCQGAGSVPPCVQSVHVAGLQVTKVLLVPPGDPRIGAA
jgi:PKD domain